MSDDFTYTEDHIAYLLDKFRAFLLKQRYGNDPKKHVPYSNYQTIIVNFTNLDTELPYFISETKIPYVMQLGIPRISSEGYYYDYTFEFTSRERLPFVGNNKFLKKIWYCAIDAQNKLCIKAPSLKIFVSEDSPLSVELTAIFENPREVESMDLDSNIPIEESLITTLIELVVKELASSVYRPSDDVNDNRDGNADMHTFIRSNMKSPLVKQLDK